MVASAAVKALFIHTWYWLDEAIAIGIAQHPLTQIPRLLTQDGSPPLYYYILHFWMNAFGQSEVATHILSIVFAVATVPAAYWAGRVAVDRRVAWVAAVLAAANPFLTLYADETRMYTMQGLLSIVATGAFVSAFVHRRRPHLPIFAVALALALYTHNWGPFLAVGTVVALALLVVMSPDRRRLLVDGALAYVPVGLAYLPWLSILNQQRAHTGVPTFTSPGLLDFVAPSGLVEGRFVGPLLFVVAGAGYLAVLRRQTTQRSVGISLVVIPAAGIVVGWLASQITPAWNTRYLVALFGGILLACALGLARAGTQGLVATGVIAVIWLVPVESTPGARLPYGKSNTKQLAQQLGAGFGPRDLVISPEPAEPPVLAAYMSPTAQYTTSMGPVGDPTVVDQRDITKRIKQVTAPETLPPQLDRLTPGSRVLFVAPQRPSERMPAALLTPEGREAARAELDKDIPSYYLDVFHQTDEIRSILAARSDLRLVRRLDAPFRGSTASPPFDGLLYVKQ